MIKIIISFFLLAFFIFAKADLGQKIPKDEMIETYNAPFKNIKGNYDIFTYLSFILWQTKQDGMNIANVVFADTTKEAKILNTDFDYKPGFKAAFGANIKNDNWTILSEYTRIHTKNNSQKKVDNVHNSLDNFWQITELDNISKIKSFWKLEFDNIDLFLKRAYFVGTKLIFAPSLGIKLAFIDQKLEEKYRAEEIDYKTKVSSNSWLLGPKIGVNTKWLVSKECRFFLNVFSSLFYQHFKLNIKELQITPNVDRYKANKKEKDMNPCIETNTGVGWKRVFENKYSINLCLSYDVNLFFNQNEMRSFVESLKNRTSAKAQNLMFHGFEAKARLDF